MNVSTGNIAALAILALLLVITAALTPQAERSSGFVEFNKPGGNNTPGDFDYYTLVLSWSPTYCAGRKSKDFDPQCDRRGARPYAFVLHGLWPQYVKGFPERCRTRERPWVPRKLINQMLDIMPNPKLVIHEYKKHGTCTGLKPEGYFQLSRKLFSTIKIPRKYIEPTQAQTISPQDLETEFLAANPNLKPDMFAISCGGPGNRLREIRVCFGRSGELRACGRNENQRRLCRARRMYIPPVRTSSN